MTEILLGTSGWSYKEWIGPFYTKTDKSMLRAYTKVFKTVEIDSTFYKYPSKGTVMGWTLYSPDDFIYAAKVPKLITHEKCLDPARGVEEDLNKFIELMEPLSTGGKLGCLLLQLPPKYDYEPEKLADFFKILPTHIRFAVEFRDLSWMRDETWTLLRKYNVAYTIVDEPLLPPEIHLTSDIAYFRWHGRGTRPWYNYQYSSQQLEPWMPKVKEAEAKVKKVYGYFNNHYHGYAVENCLQVLEMLGIITPQQTEAKNRVENHFKTKAAFKEPKLDVFAAPKTASLESMLHPFIDRKRLRRAEQISDDELRIQNQTNELIVAVVREYHIIIDLKNKTVSHDCADWNKTVPAKRFCKHVGKLFLSIEPEKAADLLREIQSDQEKWQFKKYEKS
jgi:uncharacterized protein YecE (DUF72 family)